MDVLFGRSQLPVFLSFVICGVISGVFYDILKIKRRIFAERFIFLFIDDLLFCTFCTMLILFNAYSFNDGNIKWYEIPFMAMGFILYRKTLSYVFVGFCYFVIDTTEHFLCFLFTPVYAFLIGLYHSFVKCIEWVYLYIFLNRKKHITACWHFN